jgi:hypothetical protein
LEERKIDRLITLIKAFEANNFPDCSRRLDIVNKGLSGYTTSNILKILPDVIPDPSRCKIDYLVSYNIDVYRFQSGGDGTLPYPTMLQFICSTKEHA